MYHSDVTRHWIACYFNLLHSYTSYKKSVVDNTLAQVNCRIGAITAIETLYRGVKAKGMHRVLVHCFAALGDF